MDELEPYTVHIVANPLAGRDEPFFGPVAAALGDADIRWTVHVTNGPGEESALARRALDQGAKVVVAFGGDGTVGAVADAIAGSEATLGILPGGTANVFAQELGIPLDLEAAAQLIAGPHTLRAVDLGTAELADGSTRSFILRVSVGLEATMVEQAPREEKERLGQFAYVAAALRQLPDPPVAHYTIKNEEGSTVDLEGLFAVLTNAASLGIGEARYGTDVVVDDARLDGIIAPAKASKLAAAAAATVAGNESEAVEHVSGEWLELSADPPQQVTVDGEEAGQTPVRAVVRPGAVRVIAPLEAQEGTTR